MQQRSPGAAQAAERLSHLRTDLNQTLILVTVNNPKVLAEASMTPIPECRPGTGAGSPPQPPTQERLQWAAKQMQLDSQQVGERGSA